MRKGRHIFLFIIWVNFLFVQNFYGQSAGDTLKYKRGRSQWIERAVGSENATIACEAYSLYPTFHNLAIEWLIDGDENLNGQVQVNYRKKGNKAWHKAMPLQRVQNFTFKDKNPRTSFWSWMNKHSGSIFGLEPGTAYEIQLQLEDPDGGSLNHTFFAHTRAIPQKARRARTVKVDPENFRSKIAAARPGDVFLLAPGHYGWFQMEKDGSKEKPIIIKADPNDFRERDLKIGQKGHKSFVVFDGISLSNRSYVHVEGILSTSPIFLFGSNTCVIKQCIIHAIYGVVSAYTPKLAQWVPKTAEVLDPLPNVGDFVARDSTSRRTPLHSKNCWITDNIIQGITPWTEEVVFAHGKNLGEGIEIAGPGNVISYNKVSGFRDAISLMEGAKAYAQHCVDIHNNEINVAGDDGIEADYAMSNVRIYNNRITNCARGVAMAPVLGGPFYLIRNVLYNTLEAYQTGRAGAGYVILHNTSYKRNTAVKHYHHIHSFVKNNVFVGAGDESISVAHSASYSRWDFDYNAYAMLESRSFEGRIGDNDFRSEKELQENTSELHGMILKAPIFHSKLPLIHRPFPAMPPSHLLLHSNSDAIDSGIVIPNINDGYSGKAPDRGAYEGGTQLPHFGPRGIGE